MFKKKLQRCIASLLSIILCGGIMCPTTNVYAAPSSSHSAKQVTESVSVTADLSAQMYDVYYYYAKDNNKASTNKKLIKMFFDESAKETFAWASIFSTGGKAGDFKYISNWSKLDDTDSSFTQTVLSKIDDSLGSGVNKDNLFESLNNLGNSQGATTADISNLNQRMAAFVYIRLNPNYLKSGKTYLWESVDAINNSDYADMLNTTLSLGHSKTLRSRLNSIGLTSAATDEEIEVNGKSLSTKYEYSINHLGVLGLGTQSETSAGQNNTDSDVSSSNPAYSTDNKVFIANEMAIYICLCEYLDWYLVEMPDIIKTAGWEENEVYKSTLTYLKIFNDCFGDMIPVIGTVYNMQNVDADNLSIKDMVNKCGASSMSMSEAIDVDTSEYVEHVDTSTPLTQFYTVNSLTGITSYDRDTILADVAVDTRFDTTIESNREQQNFENTTNGENNYEIPNTFLNTQKEVAKEMLGYLDKADENYNSKKSLSASSNSDTLKQIKKLRTFIASHEADTILDVFAVYYGDKFKDSLHTAVNDKDYEQLYKIFNDNVKFKLKIISDGDTEDITEYLEEAAESTKQGIDTIVDNLVDYGVDDSGKASSFAAVTINSFITKGMAYSTSYIPMRTNLYSPDTISKFRGDDENNEFYNFYVDYGFMRKALYMDTSASAAMDYYNANGTSTGNLRVCTLRDLINSGNNDVVLYLDSNFYNAQDAIEDGNTILESTKKTHVGIHNSLTEFSSIWKNAGFLSNDATVILSALNNLEVRTAVLGLMEPDDKGDKYRLDVETLRQSFKNVMLSAYKFNIDKFDTANSMDEYVSDLGYANTVSESAEFTEQVLKTGGYTNYANSTRASLAEVADSDYVNLSNKSNIDTITQSLFGIDLTDITINTDDNKDAIVLTSAQINQYMSGEMTYSQTITDEDKKTETTNSYTADTGYSPMMSLAYVSCLYRDSNTYTLANAVENNNPVFIASDDLCGIESTNQWYRNTLLNYALLKNLKGNAQVDITYVTDLDCPVYMDVFGNIITESGTVVIPAASNATLHAGSFKNYNYSAGLYSCYGKEYTVPSDLEGAASVLYPYFTVDNNAGVFVINGISMNVNTASVRFDKIDTYDIDTQNALKEAYLSAVSSGKSTRLNWMAMVKIANEVMRGAPIEALDKEQEGLLVTQTKSGLIAAAKFESLLDSLSGQASNTLLCIPDFSRMDNLEVWVALIIKLMMVATAAVIIIAIYRDGVSGRLGLRTIVTSALAVALTVSCIVVVPSTFQLTYYSANKFLLENEAMRILMVNEEKRQGGAEIGITKVDTVDSTGEFALQLDWVTVPWYEELETILYESTLDNLQETKLQAYRETAVYNNSDVTMYNDGAYVTTDALFDSVSVDFTFNSTGATRGLYLYANDDQQTASFYSPYYVFLRVLTANVNEYNRWLNNEGNSFTSEEDATDALEDGNVRVLGSYNYTTKYMSGNRLKTVGLCKAYFESDNFMTYDEDLLRINQIYGDSESSDNPASKAIGQRESGYNRALLFNATERTSFKNSYWYNGNVADCDMDVYNRLGKTDTMSKSERKNAYVQSELEDYYNKVSTLDSYARDFIADNKDMLGKVSDETFLKVMALNLSIKYNQLFGVTSANALEIYNMDSDDLIRLCIVPSDEAVMATSMSYPRFVYTFGGEAGVYMAAILSVIMWLGSFIKPLCTVIVYISVFMSIFVFRVVLRKPSANLWGYFVTVVLLCATNLLHAILLKIGVSLPNTGLSSLGCLVFLIVGQLCYLLVLAYVTGVSLKDWSNLGASEYEKEARLLKSKFKSEDTSAMLSGKVKHHDDNWEYYNDLINQHRKRSIR